MYAWSFAARTTDEVASLLKALGRHRYLEAADHRIHWTVDRALAEVAEPFAAASSRFEEVARGDDGLDPASRDPRLWREAEVEVVIEALSLFWDPGPAGRQVRDALAALLRAAGFEAPEHEPFASSADEPPHPELVTLDWTLLAVDELDTERHKGALTAMEDSGDEADASVPVYVESHAIAEPELCRGSFNGVLKCDLMLWADGPYSYCDYVFRGVTRSAKLVDPPVGYRDL